MPSVGGSGPLGLKLPALVPIAHVRARIVWGAGCNNVQDQGYGGLMKSLMTRLIRGTEGQDLIEYALLAAFISLIAITAITNVGTGLNGAWGGIDAQTQAVAAATAGGS